MSAPPRVSVAMAVYNGERFLRDAIDSVLAQTLEDFELIIVDDGSADSTAEILAGYGDERVVVITNGENVGLTRSLNRCLERARGEYVARMDADDVCYARRLERQAAYLDRHPTVGFLGTHTERIDERGRCVGVNRPPSGASRLRWRLLLGTPIAHPSVMFRRRLVEALGGYNDSLRYAQDHDLWVRLSFESQPANLSEPLLRLRRHGESISASHNEEQWHVYDTVTQEAARRLLGRSVPLGEVTALRKALRGPSDAASDDIEGPASLLLELHEAFVRYWRPGPLEQPGIRLDLARSLVTLARRTTGAGPALRRAMLSRAALADPRILGTRPFWGGLRGKALN